MKRDMRAALLTISFAALPAAAAEAHAFLDHADPRVGSKVAAAPAAVRLWFTQDLVAPLCQVVVSGPAGFGGAGPAGAGPGDPRSLVVALRPPVPPGVYAVRWRVLSVDTHVTQGDFSFTVTP